ncbi:abnormal spindle-like microcephaly-associated protein-like protein [Pyrus ussuriensis x Pyrus communis]|uniref:Abnormal spindle-like microcephaly-associated protein-like protein n=1 Tax=Pyrus ussuriensis x Pyrus communis TaxID=2448454 RepID=A0A5N5FD17_9ROSA|nr:abnormal spindle-like microcephaly-associated protein-like protein [Pyrus ussuriensis x Pyrus communis]
MEGREPPPSPSPSPYRNPSTLFKDITNFKTPKASSRISNFQSPGPKFFTASKQTPGTSSSFRRRPSLAPSNSGRIKAASRKLKAFELEQSQSSRKAQIQKEQSLKSLAKSLSVWLNFLFQNPTSCGCNLSVDGDRTGTLPKGKRDSDPGSAVGVDSAWRDPKRQRDSSWRAVSAVAFSSSKYLNLRSSLEHVCSVDDLTQRMRLYLSMGSCKEVFDAMTHVAKNIDEGRLKMKAHCPLVTDFGLKEKATRILMSYNPIWLRIGLYIVFGGDSLLSDTDANSDEELRFLKMIIEKQFFAHSGLAKDYAYNKKVEGLYRPGYYEALGNVTLKRFLMLALILDRAKCQSSLSLKYGIDGVDGGSPLLFTVESRIKSSHQVIHDFLSSDVMLGEGNISAHLVVLGYKVSYQQHPLVEYDFRVTDLFADLQDGVRLCRAIQLLLDDASILTKMVVPADTLKKNMANCGIALQYLKQAGVVLHDEDGMMIVADDIAGGDKELTLSLLWNMFVHLQLPLLVKKTNLAEEICKIRGSVISFDSSSLEMILKWIQAICENYDCKVDSFASLVDGKAIWCLLDYYFRKQLCCGRSSKDRNKSSQEESIMLATDYSDAVHNFLLSQKLLTLLGNFPEVLQISDILEYNGARNDRSVVILLVFLSSQLIVKKNMDQLNFHKLLGCDCQSTDRKYTCMGCYVRPEATQIKEETYDHHTEDSVRKFKAIQAWWQDMAERNHKSVAKPTSPTSLNLSTNKDSVNIEKVNTDKGNYEGGSIVTHHISAPDLVKAAIVVQRYIRGWLARLRYIHGVALVDKSCNLCQENVARDLQVRAENTEKRNYEGGSIVTHDISAPDLVKAAIVVQRYIRGWLARLRYIHGVALVDKSCNLCQENVARDLQVRAENTEKRNDEGGSIVTHHISAPDLVKAAIVVQRYIRGWLVRLRYIHGVALVDKSCNLCQENVARDLQVRAENTEKSNYEGGNIVTHDISAPDLFKAAIVVQRYIRGWLARLRYIHGVTLVDKSCNLCQESVARDLQVRAAIKIQFAWKNFSVRHSLLYQHSAATKIQSHFRGWLLRRRFHINRQAIIKIQSVYRMSKCWKAYQQYKIAAVSATVIQSYIRGCFARKGAENHRLLIVAIQRYFRGWLIRSQFSCQRQAAVKIQSAIRGLIWRQSFHCHRQAAVEIQRIVRGQISRNRLLGAASLRPIVRNGCPLNSTGALYMGAELNKVVCSVLKLQRWWRSVMSLNFRTNSAVIIQSHIRGWFARQKAARDRQCIVVIQSCWRGYLLRRKETEGQLLELRLRVQKSATNIDDSMRIINRLVAALSELQTMKSISGILHTCVTLDKATAHSQKCCEKLVEEGAVKTLLKIFGSATRSIPDQEVQKHVLSTLRNLARYPHLVEVLIDSPGSVETVACEFVRNKEEGYFTASELLKKVCSSSKGIEAVRRSPALLKRLHNLVEELSRKAGNNDKRNAGRVTVAREATERRLSEAVEIMKMVKQRY